MIISMDVSLRSTGLVALTDSYELIDFKLIKSKPNEGKTKKEKNNGLPILNNEQLIIYNAREICRFISEMSVENGLDVVLIEGLSFNSLSGNRDLVDGNHWHIRASVVKTIGCVPLEVVTIQSWRNKILNKHDRAEAKEKYGKKWQKMGVVDKLPADVKKRFVVYLKKNGYINDGLYDLSDAYSIGKYWLDLDQECEK